MGRGKGFESDGAPTELTKRHKPLNPELDCYLSLVPPDYAQFQGISDVFAVIFALFTAHGPIHPEGPDLVILCAILTM